MIVEKITGKQFKSKNEVFDFLFSLGYKCHFSINKDYLKKYGSSVELASHEYKVNFAFHDEYGPKDIGTYLYAIHAPKLDLRGLIVVPEDACHNACTNKIVTKLNLKTIKQVLFP